MWEHGRARVRPPLAIRLDESVKTVGLLLLESGPRSILVSTTAAIS
jgi:hypothetical protein